MKTEYISRALCFHGQPMQKIWEDERGAGDLQKWGVPPQPNISIYLERQKHFTFHDRAKRFKLHQFFARKATSLYDSDLAPLGTGIASEEVLEKAKSFVAVMPPYEVFVNKNQDKIKRWRCVLEGIKPGDIIYGIVTKNTPTNSATPMMVKPLCTAEPLVRYLSDIPTKAYIHYANMSPLPLNKLGKPRSLVVNDYVCCEVLEISVDADRLHLGTQGVLTKNKKITLGLVNSDDLPLYYRKSNENLREKYEDCLLRSQEILNPNYDILYEINGLKVNETHSMMSCFKYQFPRHEYAKELRQTQASKWAFRSVAEGIERFKIGHHVEAFQCLNQALNIDPCNVEGLVARGALYANKGSFRKAVDDFEKALKLNSYHVNARKYMGETLVALGRNYEDENNIKEAARAFSDCLSIIPNHEQAQLLLEAIQQRYGFEEFDNLFKLSGSAKSETKEKKESRSTSSDSRSEDSSENSTCESSDEQKSDHQHNKHNISLSPLSKRMALHAESVEGQRKLQIGQPFYVANYNRSAPVTKPNDFTLEDDDTQTRVRKLLQEASKHKKNKSKKSKKKKTKKSKKVKGKDKMEFLGKINLDEAFEAISSMQLENQLNENLQVYEKSIAKIKLKQQGLLTQIESTLSDNGSTYKRQRSETPPPKPPSMKMPVSELPTTSRNANKNASAINSFGVGGAAASYDNQPSKLSFQIRKPVKMDKFGLVRLATPPKEDTPSPRARNYRQHDSTDRTRSRSRSRRRRRPTRSRSSSISSYRRRRRYGRRSSSSQRRRSRSHSLRSRSRHSRKGKRRSPSPFQPRRTPSARHRRRERSSSNEQGTRKKFGNRVWQRPGYTAPTKTEKTDSTDGRWLHDKFEDKSDVDDGPSIEEIDEIINKAQKERKEEIIKRDKNILKKSTGGAF